jgi:polysaccharide export outer membrane protein
MFLLLLLLVASGAVAQTRNAPLDLATANLPAQPIGPEDLIAVSVYDAPEFTRTARVGSDGLIRLPMLRQRLQAEGLLPADLETVIAAALSAEQLMVDPVVAVTVVEYHSRPISVLGAVRNPVTFQAAGTLTLLDALTRAGGLSPEAGSEILVSRKQAGADPAPASQVERIPVRGLIDEADPALNLRLSGGEEIRVPEAGRVFVVGNVKKPGAYPIQDGADTGVLKMLALAEGLTPFSSRTAYIYRRAENSPVRQEIPIPLKQIMQRKSGDVPLLANDILYIPDNSGQRTGVAVLEKIVGFGASTASGVLVWRR